MGQSEPPIVVDDAQPGQDALTGRTADDEESGEIVADLVQAVDDDLLDRREAGKRSGRKAKGPADTGLDESEPVDHTEHPGGLDHLESPGGSDDGCGAGGPGGRDGRDAPEPQEPW